MNYDNLIFFFAKLSDFSQDVLSRRIFEFQDTKIKYSILGCTQENYDSFVVGVPHTLISRDVAVKGSKWWSEIRAEKKDYVLNPETGNFDIKIYISISDDAVNCVLEAMKIYANLLIDDEIASGNVNYSQSTKQIFANASSISDINIAYEDFLGIEMPLSQAVDLNKVTPNGQRIFNENRLSISI